MSNPFLRISPWIQTSFQVPIQSNLLRLVKTKPSASPKVKKQTESRIDQLEIIGQIMSSLNLALVSFAENVRFARVTGRYVQ